MNIIGKLILPGLFIFSMSVGISSCLVVDDDPIIEDSILRDTSKTDYVKRGLVRDARGGNGLAGAKVSIYAIITHDSSQLLGSTTTDSNGIFLFRFRYLKFNPGFQYDISHPNPLFQIHSFKVNGFSEHINDSTSLHYLHRKAACKINLINSDGKVKNVMVFTQSKVFSKVLLNLRADTSFVYLMGDQYKDVVYFDYLPQRNLMSREIRGSTAGDTVNVEFHY